MNPTAGARSAVTWHSSPPAAGYAERKPDGIRDRRIRISNSAKGLGFRDAAQPIIERYLGVAFSPEVSLPIGNPSEQHKFDLVAEDMTWVLECKALAWRENGGVPQAKITSITEAAICLRDFVHQTSRRVIVLSRATHSKRLETLAEYYARLHRHNLAGCVTLVELDTTSDSMRWLVGLSG